MKILTYIVPTEKLEAELEWLDGLRIYPAKEVWYDFEDFTKKYTRLGMIVNEDDELAITLRITKFEFRTEWKRK